MQEPFVSFPRTPHIAWLGADPPRGDRLLDPRVAGAWLRDTVCVEEKVDGANLGLWVDEAGRLRAQSRGRILSPRDLGQWEPLWSWLAARDTLLRQSLGGDLIAFGEWCYATHTVRYDALPDWFVLFDVYDRREPRFWSRARRNGLARDADLAVVPLVAEGAFTLQRLADVIGASSYGPSEAEGVYLRWDGAEWLEKRAKLVRPGWTAASDEDWRKVRRNRLAARDA